MSVRPSTLVRLASAWPALRPERRLVRSSAAVSVGFGLARLLGFCFSVAAARVLGPADFGRMSYALTVASIAGIFVTTAPTGLARFLSRGVDPARRSAYYSNWTAVMVIVLLLTTTAAVPYAVAMGLGGGMVVGVVLNLAGVAVMEGFREIERGLDRFTLFSVYYVLANVLQLAAIPVLTAAGWRSPELLVLVYGGSPIAALLAVRAFAGVGVSLDPSMVEWRRLWAIARFIRPVLLQSVFWNVWFFSDVVLVQKLVGSTGVGNYAAAKAIANGFAILPSAVVYVLVPRIARADAGEVRAQLARALVLTAIISAPVALAVAAFSAPVVGLLFGHRYPAAAAPTTLLVIGMVVFGLKAVVGAVWLGLGHPVVEAISAGVAMVGTVLTGLALVPSRGLVGAAEAFLVGAVAQLLVIAGITVWALAGARPRVRHLADESVLEIEARVDG